MSGPNPICTVNGLPTPAVVGANATFTIALANPAGALYWFLQAVDSDETTSVPAIQATLVVNQVTKTATCVAPTTVGSSVSFLSTVSVSAGGSIGVGLDVNGQVNPAFTTRFKVNVPTALNLRVLSRNETVDEGSSGWVAPVNAAIRAIGTGGGGGGGTISPNSVLALRTTLPANSRDFKPRDSYSFVNDGGGGFFVWNSTDTRPDDSGTIIAVSGVGTGRWNRVLEGNGYNVRWFGALGNATAGVQNTGTDDGPAFNLCSLAVFAAQTRLGLADNNSPHVFVPAGHYRISTTVELNNFMKMRGEGSGEECTLQGDAGVDVIRSGAFYTTIENISIVFGRSGIVFWGNSVHYGDLSLVTSYGGVYVRGCHFRALSGPAVYLDTSTVNRGSPSILHLDNCDWYTGCAFFGGFDKVLVHGGAGLGTSGGAGPTWAVRALDDNGHDLPFFVSYDVIQIENFFFTPAANGTFPTYYFIAGTGHLTVHNTHVGGEARMGFAKVTNTIPYRGQSMPVFSAGNVPEVSFHDNVISCLAGDGGYPQGHNLLEIQDQLPALVDIVHRSPNGTGGLFCKAIVWIDQATVPKTAYASIDRASMTWNLDTFSELPPSMIVTGTDPRSANGEDVTPYFFQYMTPASWPLKNTIAKSSYARNWWSSGTQTLAGGFDRGTSNMVLNPPETATGYGLITATATAFPASLTYYFTHCTDGMPAGPAVLSFHVLCNCAGVVQVRYTDNFGGLGAIVDNIPFAGGVAGAGDALSMQLVRLAIPFHHDGTSKGFAFTIFDLGNANSVSAGNPPVAATVGIGLFKLECGVEATEFTTGGNPGVTDDSRVVSYYYVAGSPPVSGGPFAVGDIAWNMLFGVSGANITVNMWRCTVAGSPGTWVPDLSSSPVVVGGDLTTTGTGPGWVKSLSGANNGGGGIPLKNGTTFIQAGAAPQEFLNDDLGGQMFAMDASRNPFIQVRTNNKFFISEQGTVWCTWDTSLASMTVGQIGGFRIGWYLNPTSGSTASSFDLYPQSSTHATGTQGLFRVWLSQGNGGSADGFMEWMWLPNPYTGAASAPLGYAGPVPGSSGTQFGLWLSSNSPTPTNFHISETSTFGLMLNDANGVSFTNPSGGFLNLRVTNSNIQQYQPVTGGVGGQSPQWSPTEYSVAGNIDATLNSTKVLHLTGTMSSDITLTLPSQTLTDYIIDLSGIANLVIVDLPPGNLPHNLTVRTSASTQNAQVQNGAVGGLVTAWVNSANNVLLGKAWGRLSS